MFKFIFFLILLKILNTFSFENEIRMSKTFSQNSIVYNYKEYKNNEVIISITIGKIKKDFYNPNCNEWFYRIKTYPIEIIINDPKKEFKKLENEFEKLPYTIEFTETSISKTNKNKFQSIVFDDEWEIISKPDLEKFGYK